MCHQFVHCEPIVARVIGSATALRYTKLMSTTKDSERQLVQRQLEMLSDADYEVSSRRAYRNLRSVISELYGSNDSFTILLYHALSYWREVDVSELTGDYLRASFEYVDPKKHAPEPQGVYDVIVIPLYGFTKDGYRLGHGAGWYDRLSSKQPDAIRIGVGLEAGLIDFSIEEHDIPMDILITEDRSETLRKRIHR